MTESSQHHTEIDIEHLRQWLGRSETAEDIVTPRLAAHFLATFDEPSPAPEAGEPAPLAIHWCLAPSAAPMSSLGPDGHAARGGFLPPVPLPRRMWAGGRLELLAPLRAGETVTRLSTVKDISLKEGRSGRLCFVVVEHLFASERGELLKERQDIVYREAARPSAGSGAPPAGAPEPLPRPTWRKRLTPDPVLLFRYSALTFNGHRIHYDRRYCIEEEGYRGLVVHGPLQASWLLRLAAEARGAPPKSFAFRGLSPLFDGTEITLNAAEDEDGLRLWVADADGRATMRAEAGW
ncbi:FAS1-like dehydratase domain-containing protein [Afifella pfennigii]|uniref:FAS1-like dehydratase domain-containing protein n=1 Tax=Afifella pfennigii TaxID=209897 RepID=UPI00047D4419|nr:MaoC family dehydratase N-terminal domain-containing protein [Afifella pfennigii]